MMLRRQRDARAATTETPADPVPIEDMKGPDLKAALKALDLPVSGKVDELRARLTEARTPAEVTPPATDDNGDETAGKALDEVADDITDAEAETVATDDEPDPAEGDDPDADPETE